MLFILGFLLLMLGFAMVVIGPLPEEGVNTALVNWLLFGLCLLGGAGWIVAAGRPARAAPVGESEPPSAAKPARAANRADLLPPALPPDPSSPRQRNPFDFS